MKKLMFMAAIAMVLTVFNACTKDELPADKQVSRELSSKKPDVYLENDYLVVKNFEAVGSLKMTLQNKSLEEQASWENQLGLKSAKTFRAQASDKLGEFQSEADAENYAKELVKEGYFSMRDSSMCYPFYNYSWDCVLNKNGVIKIGDVLYCFQKDAQISVMDGKLKTLNQFLSKPESCDTALVKAFSFPKLKSTTPTNYGKVADIVQYNSGHTKRFILGLYWEPVWITVKDVYGNDVKVQSGNMYQLYFHNETKSLWWWNDNRTYFYNRHLNLDLGGNYDPIKGQNFYRYIDNTAGTFYQVNSTSLANVYHEVRRWEFGSWYDEGTFPSYPGATINSFSCQGACDTFGGTTNSITLTIN